MIYHATAWGPWAFSDATGYITATRNLVAGHGIGAFEAGGRFSPGVSHPPLYVLTLGALSFVGAEPLQAARILDVLFFGMLVAGCGLLTAHVLGSRSAGLAYAALLLLHPALIIAYTSAMAEPPFILLGLLSLLLLTKYLMRPGRALLLAAALAAGGALLSRYPGATYGLTGAAAIALWGSPAPMVRLRRAGIFAILAALPVGVFLLWSATLPGSEGPRALGGGLDIVPALLQFGRSAGAAIWSWKPIPPAVLWPDRLEQFASPALVSGLVSAAGSLALLLLSLGSVRQLSMRRRRLSWGSPGMMLLRVFALFVAGYLAFFVAAYLATDPTPDVDSRTLLPVLPALLGSGVAFVQASSAGWRPIRALRIGWIGLLLTALAGYAVISWDIVSGLHRTGLGYTSREWRGSPTIASLRNMPPDLALISNEPSAVLLLTGRTPYMIHEIAQSQPTVEFTPFGSGTSEAEQVFRRGQARLVLFDTVHDQFDSLYRDRSEERYTAFVSGLVAYERTEDGTIYGYPSDGDPP